MCIVHPLLSSSAFLFQAASFVTCFNVIFQRYGDVCGGLRSARDTRSMQWETSIGPCRGLWLRFHPALLRCSSIHLWLQLLRAACTSSLLLYIVAGWVMPDFFSGCLEGQLCYARVSLLFRAFALAVCYWHFVRKRGGGCLFTFLSLSAFIFQTSSSRRIFCVLRCFRLKCRGDFILCVNGQLRRDVLRV